MYRLILAGIALLPLSCASNNPVPDAGSLASRPPPGSNEILREKISIADGLEIIVSDVVIPANATVPRHYHPGEEFLYVLEGSAVQVEQGKPDRVLSAGDAYVIAPRAIHSPRAGPRGARAVVCRVHIAGEAERIPVP